MASRFRHFPPWARGCMMGALMAAFFVFALARHPVGARFQYDTMDAWVGLRDPLSPGPVAVLAIDQATARRWGGYATFDASDIARLLRLLKKAGVRSASFTSYQVIASAPDGAGELARAMRETGLGCLPLDFDYSANEAGAALQTPPPASLRRFAESLSFAPATRAKTDLPSVALHSPPTILLDAAPGAGHINFILDANGHVRKTPLALEYDGANYPALTLSMAQQMGVHSPAKQYSGGAILLNYLSGASTDIPTLSVATALTRPERLKWLRGQAVIIGPTLTGATTLFSTPAGNRVPAVMLHALALDNLLTGRALRVSPSLWVWGLAILAGAITGAVSGARASWLGALTALLLAIGLAAVSLLAFSHYFWLDITPGWFGVASAFLVGVIARARRQERSGARVAATVEALTQVSRVIAIQTQPHEILGRVLDWTQSVIPAERAQVLLLDETDGNLHYVAVSESSGDELLQSSRPMDAGVAVDVVQSGQAKILNEASRDWRLDSADFGARSLLCVPLRTGERTLGALQLVNREGGLAFTSDDAELLGAVAGQAAAALDNSRMYGNLHELVEQARADLERTNRRLEAEKGLLSTVLQSMSDGVAVTDEAGLVQLINPAATALLPELAGDAINRSLNELLPEIAIGEENENQTSLQLRRGEGDKTRMIEVRTAPLRALESGAQGWIAVFADVTRAEEIQQAKSDFVSFVAHEMRSPLTSIAGFTALLLREAEDGSPPAHYLGIIRDESERLTRLINGLLDVARIEAGGGLDLYLETLDFAIIANQAAALQRGYSDKHEIVCELPGDLPSVRADADKAKQILINLLSNAQKHTPRGGRFHHRARLSIIFWKSRCATAETVFPKRRATVCSSVSPARWAAMARRADTANAALDLDYFSRAIWWKRTAGGFGSKANSGAARRFLFTLELAECKKA